MLTADSVCPGCLSAPASSLPVQVALGLRCELTKIQFLHLKAALCAAESHPFVDKTRD